MSNKHCPMFRNKSVIAVSCNHELIAKTMTLACCSYEDLVFGIDWSGEFISTFFYLLFEKDSLLLLKIDFDSIIKLM